MADEQTNQAAAGSGQSSSTQGQAASNADPKTSPNGAADSNNNSQQGQGQTAAAAKPARPDWLPETHWDGGKSEIKSEFGQHYRDLSAFKAAEDSRKLTLPAKPEDYRAELPKDFKPPAGIEFVFNDKNPLLPQARAFAQKHGLSQDGFAELMGLHAAGQVGTEQTIANSKAAEIQKLGVNGTARKTAVDTWMKAQLGDDLGQHMSEFTFTARQVEGFEKLMERFRTQGASSFNAANRDPAHENGKIPGYEKMSFEQRRQAQDQMAARQTGR